MKSAIKSIAFLSWAVGLAAPTLAQTSDSPTAGLPESSTKKAAQRIKVVVPPSLPAKEEATLRLNFRGAPMETVLSHLSEAAGYTIILRTPLRGTLDVWNNQPMTKTEALEALNAALNKN